MSLAEDITRLAPVEKVQFSFESAEDVGHWRVAELHSSEGLSELYSCTLELANEDVAAESDDLLGISCHVQMSRGATARRLCGIVHRLEHLGAKGGHALVRAHVVPALWGLSQRRDAYIFQEMTVPQILKDVLGEGLQPFERTYRLELQREYLPREYCVQYQETDLDFVLRLMEEEGIGFYFDHSGEREELVLFDDSSQCLACETALGMAVTIRRSEGMTTSDETLRAFEYVNQMRSTNVVVRDFDWTQPQVDITNQAGEADQRGFEREVYDYPAPQLVGPYDPGGKRYKHDRAHQARLRREALDVGRRQGSGSGDVLGFTAGYSFELTGHPHPALDQKYLLTRVQHSGHAPEELLDDATERLEPIKGRERYTNAFECIPFTVPFRPELRRTRVRMSGLQTGTVVGPSGEEVHTDEHGRIKVQFHWDREGQRDEHSSCFLRVAQSWAGAGFGTFFLPRIGMEVLIDFLEGDPDRPIVVGCVYNGQNPAPYAPEENKTRSTLRTQSSPGGDGYNELRFEDAAGEEEIFLHAQKDLNETVENNHSTTVHANQTNSVDGNQAETVKGEQAMTVDKNRTVNVKGSQSVKIDGEQANSGVSGSKLDITGDYKVDASNTIEVQAPTHIKFTVGDSYVLIEPAKITLMSKNGSKVVLDVNAEMRSSAESFVLLTPSAEMKSSGGSNVLLNTNAEMKAHGEATVTLSANAVMGSKGGSHVTLNGNATVHGAGTATVDAPDSATVQSATAKIKGDGGSVTADGSGVNASGGSATISGEGTVTVTGGMIKLN